MLICEDVVSNDVIIVGTCFSLFVNICARFRFALIGRGRGQLRVRDFINLEFCSRVNQRHFGGKT